MINFKGILFISVASLINYRCSAEMLALGKQNFTSEWLLVAKGSLLPPLVSEMKDHLVYVTFLASSIRLESSKIVNKPCEIPTTLNKDRKSKLISPAYAETLGNGKVVVSLFESNKRDMNESIVWLYVIDSKNCTFNIDKFVLDKSIASARDAMTIVPYQDSFDVFLQSNGHCKSGTICNVRYNDKLELIDSPKLALPFEDGGWDITPTKDFDSSEGYLYIVMMKDTNSTNMKWLDSNLTVTQSSTLNYSGSIAYWYGDNDSASLCFGLSDQEIECVLLDSEMRPVEKTTLFYDSFIQYYSIFRLGNGDAVILTILSSDPDGSDPATYVQHVMLNGTLSSPIKFQDFICENVFEMNTFKLADDLYCVSTICRNVINTRCIGPLEQREF